MLITVYLWFRQADGVARERGIHTVKLFCKSCSFNFWKQTFFTTFEKSVPAVFKILSRFLIACTACVLISFSSIVPVDVFSGICPDVYKNPFARIVCR